MIIEPAAAAAFRASLAALTEDDARALAGHWLTWTYNEIAVELFREAGLSQQAEELAALDLAALSPDELERALRDHHGRINDSPLWSERSHAECESLRRARTSVAAYGLRALIENNDAHERAERAAFHAIATALHLDHARAMNGSLETAPSAQQAFDRIRRDVAARGGSPT